MTSEPADGGRPVHAVQSEWILSGARGKESRPEAVKAEGRDLPGIRAAFPALQGEDIIRLPEAADRIRRDGGTELRSSLPNQGGTANLSSLGG